MARLLTWLDGLGIAKLEVIDNDSARNSGSNTAQDGSEQFYEGIGAVWRFRMDLTSKQGVRARKERGVLGALMSGANAMRIKLIDPDVMLPSEAGVAVGSWVGWGNIPPQSWSNGHPWSSGLGWRVSPPTVRVAASAAVDAGIVQLQDEHWGHHLGLGDRFGFFPFHFGMYQVTEVIEPGIYRVKHRLRKALTYSPDPLLVDYATLCPVVVVRPVAPAGATRAPRGAFMTEGGYMELSEVIDPYARRHFAD